MSTLQEGDQAAAAVAKAPRVALADIEAAIAERYDSTADRIVDRGPINPDLKILSICILVMRNGWIAIGKSAPASPENFNAELGRKFAYEDAIRQLWPLMGYALRDRLAAK
jgi:Phage protein (N4 Gp49/phage Sf6 gene 66) family